MSNETKKTALPKLRFPEFVEAEEWVEKPLGNIMTITSCKRVHESDWTTEGVPFFRAREIVALRNKVEISPLFISETLYQKNIKQSGEIKPGDLLVTGVGTIGVPYSVKEGDRFYFKDGNIIWFQNPGDVVSGNFLFWLYESNYIKKQISRIAGVGTVGTYTIDNAKRTLIPLSSQEEQQKIAECFSALDDLINAQNTKLAALQTHKKGLMQELFPAEGETVPKLRFPEFQDAEEWENLPIGGKVDLLSGFPFKSAEISEDATGVPLMRGINVTSGFVRHSKDIDRFFLGSTQKLEKYKLRTDDLVIGMDGSKVGKNSALITEVDSGSLLIQRVARLRAKPHTSIQFIYHQINSSSFHSYVDRVNTSGGIPHISASQINEFEIYFPSFEEQQKVAAILTSLENRITAQSKKIEALKLHKKGLMQNLFPAAPEPNA